MNTIVIVDHGMGNLGSVHNMLRKLGADVIRSADPQVVRGADKLVLAGIGAYDGAASRLAELNLVDALNEGVLDRRVPVLGVCLGMQLMARTSEEGLEAGLGWLDADVRRFRIDPEHPLPVPHMGWEEVHLSRPTPLFAASGEQLRFYFSHAYHLVCHDQSDVAATAVYGYEFPAAVQRGNIFGTQFHPEKSHVFGFDVYRRFMGLETAFYPRIVPVLLLDDGGLVKTMQFAEARYIGDPINAVRIFNDKQADELVLLDIRATAEGRAPHLGALEEIVSEAFMPLAYGGGIRDLQTAISLIQVGIEKVVVNALTIEDPEEVRRIADRLGGSTLVAAMDAVRRANGDYVVATHNATHQSETDIRRHAEAVAAMGAGEVLLNSVDRDGTMGGYDLELVRQVAAVVDIPVVACGGAGSMTDLASAVTEGGAAAAAAGSFFVFHGRHRAVLITYPSYADRAALFAS